jgi:hypothetical protein
VYLIALVLNKVNHCGGTSIFFTVPLLFIDIDIIDTIQLLLSFYVVLLYVVIFPAMATTR